MFAERERGSKGVEDLMKFAMVGSGAVGCYFGARLLLAGHDVTFIARGERLRALREQGITLVHGDEPTRIPQVGAVESLNEVDAVDYVFLGVKTWQVAEAAQTFSALTAEHTRFLTLQNGVDAPHEVAGMVGARRTLGGIVRGFFEMTDLTTVRHVGVPPTIIYGQIDGGRSAPTDQLLRLLTEAGINAEHSTDIEASLWEKFLLVTALSGVGTVTRSTVGEFRACAETRHMLYGVLVEMAAVARARGVRLRDDAADRTLAFIDTFPATATTSLHRDLINGLPSELEAQTGAVVRMGRETGVPTPINQFIYASLLLQEARNRAGMKPK